MLCFFLIFPFLFNQITPKATFAYLYPITIGDPKTEIQMILDSTISNSIVFSDLNRPYADKILSETEMNTFKDSLSIQQATISDFPFTVKPDNTEWNNNQIQGALSWGISLDNKNDVIDALFNKGIITSKRVYWDTTPTSQLKFSFDVNKEEDIQAYDRTSCQWTVRDDIDVQYHNSWVCDFTHLFVGSNLSNVTLDQGWIIYGRAVFDTTSYYITAPSWYYETIKDLLEISDDTCRTEYNDLNETIIVCKLNESSEEEVEEEEEEIIPTMLKQLKSWHFMLDGYAYEIPGKDLFINDKNGTSSFLIKFRNETNNIWTFGNPFFKQYNISFDYDNNRVGIAANDMKLLNLTEEWNEWSKKNNSFLRRDYYDKTIILVSSIIGTLIIVFIISIIIKRILIKDEPAFIQFIEEH